MTVSRVRATRRTECDGGQAGGGLTDSATQFRLAFFSRRPNKGIVMIPLPLIPGAVSLTGVWLASAFDLGSYRVPNWLTLPLILSGLIYQSFLGTAGLLSGASGLFFMAFVFVPLWLRGGFGAGDAKLAMGIGAWLGIPWTVYAFVGTGLCAGLYALAYLLMGRTFVWSAVWSECPAGETVVEMTKSPKRNSRLAAFAPFMAVGLTAAVVYSWAIRVF